MEVDRKELLAALDTVRKAVAKQEIVPEFSNFLIEDGEITATDGDIGLVTAFAPFADMSFLIPADRFYKLIKGLPQKILDISANGCLVIKAKGHESKLVIEEVPSDFPHVRREFRDWQTPPDNLIDSLKVCLKTLNESHSNRAFGGIFWGERSFVSTDTVIISWCDSDVFPDESVMLSSQFAREAVKLGQPTGFVIHEGAICFQYENTQLLGHLITAEFPSSWRSWFPDEAPDEMIGLDKDVGKALARVGTFSENTFGDGMTKVIFDGKRLIMSYSDSEGDIVERMAMKTTACQFSIPGKQLAGVLGFCNEIAYMVVDERPILYLQGEGGWPRIVMSAGVEVE